LRDTGCWPTTANPLATCRAPASSGILSRASTRPKRSSTNCSACQNGQARTSTAALRNRGCAGSGTRWPRWTLWARPWKRATTWTGWGCRRSPRCIAPGPAAGELPSRS